MAVVVALAAAAWEPLHTSTCNPRAIRCWLSHAAALHVMPAFARPCGDGRRFVARAPPVGGSRNERRNFSSPFCFGPSFVGGGSFFFSPYFLQAPAWVVTLADVPLEVLRPTKHKGSLASVVGSHVHVRASRRRRRCPRRTRWPVQPSHPPTLRPVERCAVCHAFRRCGNQPPLRAVLN